MPHVDVYVEASEVLHEISDEELLAEISRRGIVPSRPKRIAAAGPWSLDDEGKFRGLMAEARKECLARDIGAFDIVLDRIMKLVAPENMDFCRAAAKFPTPSRRG